MKTVWMSLLPALGVLVSISQASAIEGGRKATSVDAISHSAVAVNIHFAGLPGAPPPNPPDHSLNPCTGVIIDNDLVLTAAHCIKPNSGFQIIFDMDAGNPHAIVRDVAAFDVPLEFHYGSPNPNQRSDIALLYFQGSLPAGYTKAKLLLDSSSLKSGAVVSAAGYGPCRDAAHCSLSIMNTDIARDDYWPTEIQLQASSAAYPTSGDSGGPAYIISSEGELQVFGLDNGSWANLIEVYDAIGAHADWMQKASVRLRTTDVSQGPGWDQ